MMNERAKRRSLIKRTGGQANTGESQRKREQQCYLGHHPRPDGKRPRGPHGIRGIGTTKGEGGGGGERSEA
eukprot:2508748-Rhodomonas_salina.2